MTADFNTRTEVSGPTRKDAGWAVVLIAHGSQRGADRSECSCAWVEEESGPPGWCLQCPNTQEGLGRAACRVQILLDLREPQLVLSCLEFIEPTPQQVVQMLGERGFRHAALVPFLLGNGKHATLELEEIIEELRSAAPAIRLHLAQGLGANSGLADLVVQRIRGMDWPPQGRTGEGHVVGVVLVKAGTKTQYDDCQWLREMARLVEARLGPGFATEIAQSHYGLPTMEAATERLVHDRRVSSLLYVPYLFFPGLILKRNVLGGMAGLREKYPDIPMSVIPPLGAETQAAAAAAQRVRETWRRAQSQPAQPAQAVQRDPGSI